MEEDPRGEVEREVTTDLSDVQLIKQLRAGASVGIDCNCMIFFIDIVVAVVRKREEKCVWQRMRFLLLFCI